jgi:hypothetical protein
MSHSVFASHTKSKSILKTNSWILDTGAIDRMVHSLSCLTTITSTIHATVELPNEDFVPVTNIGTVKFSSSLILTNVLCVPSFHFNLISVSKLLHSSFRCRIFLSNYCFIQAFTPWRMIGLGEIHNGIYILQTPVVEHTTILPSLFHSVNNVAASVSTPTSMQIWHCRLGHPSLEKLTSLHEKCI